MPSSRWLMRVARAAGYWPPRIHEIPQSILPSKAVQRDVLDLLQYMTSSPEYAVDTSRVYLMGNSMGGMMAGTRRRQVSRSLCSPGRDQRSHAPR